MFSLSVRFIGVNSDSFSVSMNKICKIYKTIGEAPKHMIRLLYVSIIIHLINLQYDIWPLQVCSHYSTFSEACSLSDTVYQAEIG